MQFFGQGKPPVGILFDCALGSRIDDALALALLYGVDGKNEARMVSVTVSKANLKAAMLAEVIGRFYAGAVSAAFGSFSRTLPVGLSTDGKLPEDTPMLTLPLERKEYTHGIHKLNDTADPTAVIRNALTAHHDDNAIVVLAGPGTNLVKVLALPGAKELIAKKVRYLSVVAGEFPASAAEQNVKTDIAAMRRIFAEWPTPVYVAGAEVGRALPYPGASIEQDFAWSPAHPVVDAYRAYGKMPYDAPAADLAAALYAIRPKENFFQLSEPGTVRVLDDGRTQFTAAAGGKHRYLIVDPAQKDRVIRTYVELTSAKPVPKAPRFPRKQQQKEEKK